MHWADVLARELQKETRKHVLATGITPSGPIHIGNMREVLTVDAVYRSLRVYRAAVSFIYIADDFDHLRKVYPYLPNSYERFVGMPISEIPCVCGGHKSYADHYLSSFFEALKELGVHPRMYRASVMYKNGDYAEAIQKALENKDKIKEIIEFVSKRKLPKNWIPFNIRCEQCGKINSAKPVLYEFPIIEYTCECNYSGSVDIRQGGVGKLPWRIDWPARWKMLGVTFEPFGKDLGTVGGARDTGERIAREIYEYPPPKYTMYEFILLKGKGAMHSSKGTALSAEEMLHMTPPEVLRFLIMRNQPNKHIMFDPGLGLLNLVDEYDQLERMYFEKEEKTRGIKDMEKNYYLSQPENIPEKIPYQVPYRHLVTLIQIGKEWDKVKKILVRTGQIPDELCNHDERHLQRRVMHVKYWLKYFAPDTIRFEVKKQVPKVQLNQGQKKLLTLLIKTFTSIEWKAEDIHKAIYEVSETIKIPIQTAFKTIYQVILGQGKGPRAGYFLSNLDRKFILKRFREGIK